MSPNPPDFNPFRAILTRFSALFAGRKLDAALDEELRAHIDLATAENMTLGMNRKQARRTALQNFGGLAQTRETYRQRRGFPLLDQASRDLRFALRQLHRAPGFAFTAILTLALGLGANTAIFSLINALLLRPLPVPHADRLVVVNSTSADDPGLSYSFSAPLIRALEKRHAGFEQMAAFSRSSLQVRSASGNEQVYGELVSGQFFAMMQTAPRLGRYLTPQDDVASQGYAAVLSEDFWRSHFNAAPDIVGRKIVIANVPFTIAGVMPASFIGADPTARPGIYLPLAAEPITDAPYDSIASGFHSIWLRILGRLEPGVSIQQADAALKASTRSLLESGNAPADVLKRDEETHFALGAESGSRGFTYLRIQFRKPLIAVFCLCGAVLLLACLNLASLLMARAASRERELATRLAIGASRARLIQQLLLESLLIAALGTAAGLALSPLVSHALAAMLLGNGQGAGQGVVLDTSLDFRVYFFAALLTALVSVLIGLVPALRATSGDLNEQIKNGAYARTSQKRQPMLYRLLPRVLMASEVTLALMLVFGAGLLATSLVRLYRTGLGFEPKGIVNLDLDMDKQPLKGSSLIRRYQSFADTLSHQPGVESVSYASIIPLAGSMTATSLATPFSQGDHQVDLNDVAPNYFHTMHIPILQGRDFAWNDTASSGLTIILNQSAAKLFFPGRNPIGQTLPHGKKTLQVIGVVGDINYDAISKAAPLEGYFPITQCDEDDKTSYTAVVRLANGNGSTAPFAASARKIAAQMAPDIPAPVLTTMSSTLDDSISSERMMALLSVFFALCALLVTAIGLYGTLAYSTARRTSEIGIRMALGAQRLQVVALVFRENAWVSLSGCAAGLIAALLASKALASFLYSTSTRDPWVLCGSVLALAAIASAASLLPAIRAARTDPMQALRTE
jgi:predicted permease